MGLDHMSADQLANWSASALLAVTSAAAVVTYHVRAPAWHRSRMGRHVMTVTVALGLLGAYTVVVSVWPTGPTATVLRVARTVLLVILAVSMVQRVRLIADAQRHLPDRPPDGS